MRKRSTLEAGFGTEKSATDEGLAHHSRSADALQSALRSNDPSLDLPAHAKRFSIGVMSQTIAGLVERNTTPRRPDEAVDDAEAKVEHCGWLLKQGRAVLNWKMRWVLLQAGSLWYFKDQTLKEQLGRMPLFGCKLEPGATARHFSLVSEQRTLHLRAADRTEALAWQAVLRRALAELAPAQSAERVLVDGVEALLAPLLDVGAAGGNAALLPEQEEALCVLLLTLHSFSTAERLAELLRDAYHASYYPSAAALPLKMWAALEQAPRRRRVGYTLLRWGAAPPPTSRAPTATTSSATSGSAAPPTAIFTPSACAPNRTSAATGRRRRASDRRRALPAAGSASMASPTSCRYARASTKADPAPSAAAPAGGACAAADFEAGDVDARTHLRGGRRAARFRRRRQRWLEFAPRDAQVHDAVAAGAAAAPHPPTISPSRRRARRAEEAAIGLGVGAVLRRRRRARRPRRPGAPSARTSSTRRSTPSARRRRRPSDGAGAGAFRRASTSGGGRRREGRRARQHGARARASAQLRCSPRNGSRSACRRVLYAVRRAAEERRHNVVREAQAAAKDAHGRRAPPRSPDARPNGPTDAALGRAKQPPSPAVQRDGEPDLVGRRRRALRRRACRPPHALRRGGRGAPRAAQLQRRQRRARRAVQLGGPSPTRRSGCRQDARRLGGAPETSSTTASRGGGGRRSSRTSASTSPTS